MTAAKDPNRGNVAEDFVALVHEVDLRYHEKARTLLVHRADRVAALIRDERLWNQRGEDDRLADLSPEMRPLRTAFRDFIRLWPAFSAGAYHERVRAELVDGLAGTAAAATRRQLARDVEDLLPPGPPARFDWVGDFARPFALRMLAGIVGADADEAAHLARLGAVVLDVMAAAPSNVADLRSALAAIDDLHRWLGTAIERPATSRMVAALARVWTAPDLGPRASTAALAQIVTGSVDPLVSVLCVLAERVTADHLRRLPTAVIREEVFRLATPFRYAVRYARCPLDIGGHTVAEGHRVVLNLATANVDPAAVPDPMTITRREPQSHLAFGAGHHYCLGAGIARVAVDAVLAHMRARRQAFRCDLVDRAPEVPTLRYRALVGTLR